MSIKYDKQTDSLHIFLTQDVGESYEPKSGKFVVYIDDNDDETEIVIEGVSHFLAQAIKRGATVKDAPAIDPQSTKPVWEDVDSSMIAAFKYDESSQTLYVLFNRTGIYRYFDVPADVIEELREASSKGSFMRHAIIDYYAYTKGNG